MPRYSAQPQSLFGQTGAPNAPRPTIDIAGALDALSSGATSLMHQAMLRKSADELRQRQTMLDQRQYDQILYEHKRDSVGDARHAEETTYNRGKDQRDFDLKQTELGITPAHQEQQPSPDSLDMVPGGPEVQFGRMPLQQPVVGPSYIQRAMTQRNTVDGTAGQMPGVQVTPDAAGAARLSTEAAERATLPLPTMAPGSMRLAQPRGGTRTVNVPESYNYENSLEGRKLAAQRNRKVGDYVAAGLPYEKAMLAVDNPQIADDFLFPKRDVLTGEDGSALSYDPATHTTAPVKGPDGKPLRLHRPSDPATSAERISERQRESQWRTHYAANVAALQRPHYDRESDKDVPGLSREDAMARAQSEADDAFGPIASHLAPAKPVPKPAVPIGPGMASFRIRPPASTVASPAAPAVATPAPKGRLAAGRGVSSSGTSGTTALDAPFTDDEAADAVRAGMKTDKDAADWIRAQRRKKTP